MEAFFELILQSFTLSSLVAILFGSFMGMLIGALPGLGSTIALIMLLPMTYSMTPLAAILMLISVYQSAEYGGSISSVVLGIPGTPGAMATVLDGYPLSQRTSPGKALAYSLTASTMGGLWGGLVLICFAVPLAKLVMNIADPELFLLALCGLLLSNFVATNKDLVKSLLSLVLGLMAGTIGVDTFSGAHRFTFGTSELSDGMSIVAIMVAFFAVSELIGMISRLGQSAPPPVSRAQMKVSLTPGEFKGVAKATGLGSLIGSMVGCVPGLGVVTASWFSYSAARKLSKHPEQFGTGSPEGVAAPEAANNAAVGGNMIPLLLFGLPGNATMAIILGAFIIHGVTPGAGFLAEGSALSYGIIYGFILAVLVMYLIGRVLTPWFSKVVSIPDRLLVPVILLLSLVGIYISESSFFHMWLALALGVVCYFMERLDYSPRAFILAFILAPMLEENLRRTLLLSEGSLGIFLERPVSLTIIAVMVAVVCAVTLYRVFRRRRSGAGGADGVI